MTIILDLFAGAGGWDMGLRRLGLSHVVGLEMDKWACATRSAAGLHTIRCDVAGYPAEHFAGRVEGLVGGPPCQSFSAAGKGAGRGDMEHLLTAVRDCADGWREPSHQWKDARSRLVLEALRWTWAVRPEWLAFEQVPPVLPIWQAMAEVLRGWGYNAHAYKWNAANSGVPQTRTRAFLVAHRSRPVHLPRPTHAKRPHGRLLPWVSMAEALGWTGIEEVRNYHVKEALPHASGGACVPTFDPNERPARTLTHRVGGWSLRQNNRPNSCVSDAGEPAPTMQFGERMNDVRFIVRPSGETPEEDRWLVIDKQANASARHSSEPAPTIKGAHSWWIHDRPATTIVGTECPDIVAAPKHRKAGGASRQNDEGGVRTTIEEAGVLQDFPADYAWHGPKSRQFLQCGNAIPPGMAAAVVGALLGITPGREVEQPAHQHELFAA